MNGSGNFSMVACGVTGQALDFDHNLCTLWADKPQYLVAGSHLWPTEAAYG